MITIEQWTISRVEITTGYQPTSPLEDNDEDEDEDSEEDSGEESESDSEESEEEDAPAETQTRQVKVSNNRASVASPMAALPKKMPPSLPSGVESSSSAPKRDAGAGPSAVPIAAPGRGVRGRGVRGGTRGVARGRVRGRGRATAASPAMGRRGPAAPTTPSQTGNKNANSPPPATPAAKTSSASSSAASPRTAKNVDIPSGSVSAKLAIFKVQREGVHCNGDERLVKYLSTSAPCADIVRLITVLILSDFAV